MNTLIHKKLTLILICCFFLLIIGCEMIPGMGESKSVLFIGNSYTMTSSIPQLFSDLSKSKWKNIEVEFAASRGGDFFSYSLSPSITEMMQSKKWDYIILQEQTQTPASPYLRSTKMYPAARKLVSKIRSLGSEPIFFQTSGNRHGWPEVGQDNYREMQQEIIKGYSEIADEMNVQVAPVGQAWQFALENVSGANLWLDDRHPSKQGAYLAACVFYATLFHESPEGASYKADLSKEIAKQLQSVASDVSLRY